MRGLTLIVGETAPERLRTALTLAAANAALDGRTRLLFQGAAVALLKPPVVGPDDDRYAGAGLPTLAALFEEALCLGVEIVACQSGLQLMGVSADAIDTRVSYGGPMSVLQTLGEDRLVIV